MKKIVTIVSMLFLAILAVITLFPFVYMILAGLMTYSGATTGKSLPEHRFYATSSIRSLFQRSLP
jgi:ABC-type glycerol-3-phosphate transport system permease component